LEHYGKILNANRSYYLTRSQPPFFTDMLESVYRAFLTTPLQLRKWRPGELQVWFSRGVRASIKELLSVWVTPPRLDDIGLIKYVTEGTGDYDFIFLFIKKVMNLIGMPPETEPGHYDEVVRPYAEKEGMEVSEFIKAYVEGRVKVPELNMYFVHDRAGKFVLY
jgi:alpha,alpha-trehalase